MKHSPEALLAALPPVRPLPELLQFNYDSDERRASQAKELDRNLLRVFYLSDAELWLLGREHWFPSAYFGGRDPVELARWDQWRPVLLQFVQDWADNLERKPAPPPERWIREGRDTIERPSPPPRGTSRRPSLWERFRDWLLR